MSILNIELNIMSILNLHHGLDIEDLRPHWTILHRTGLDAGRILDGNPVLLTGHRHTSNCGVTFGDRTVLCRVVRVSHNLLFIVFADTTFHAFRHCRPDPVTRSSPPPRQRTRDAQYWKRNPVTTTSRQTLSIKRICSIFKSWDVMYKTVNDYVLIARQYLTSDIDMALLSVCQSVCAFEMPLCLSVCLSVLSVFLSQENLSK